MPAGAPPRPTKRLLDSLPRYQWEVGVLKSCRQHPASEKCEDGLLKVVEDFQTHWAPRNFIQENKSSEEEENPEPGTCYIDEDFEDSSHD